MSSPSPSPVSTPPQSATAFPHQAAKASWASGVLVFALIVFGGRSGARLAIEFIAFAFMVVGLILGVVALFGIRKHGTKYILAPALVGIIIHGLMLSIFITNFLAARAAAQRRTSALTAPVLTGADRETTRHS